MSWCEVGMSRHVRFYHADLDYFFPKYQLMGDVTEFYGSEDSMWDVYGYQWLPADRALILRDLRRLESELFLPTVDFHRFKFDKRGTESLLYYLQSSPIKRKRRLYAKYTLGCIIYHQLLYTRVLRCCIWH
jgi:hypothetical protein